MRLGFRRRLPAPVPQERKQETTISLIVIRQKSDKNNTMSSFLTGAGVDFLRGGLRVTVRLLGEKTDCSNSADKSTRISK